MLDDLADFTLFLQNYGDRLFEPPVGQRVAGPDVDTYRYHCPKCGRLQLMDVDPCWWAAGTITIEGDPRKQQYWAAHAGRKAFKEPLLDSVTPSLYILICRNCHTEFTLLLCRGPDGPQIAVFPSCHGGLSTAHTPAEASFYLDQADRARSVGARSAALAMYRAALEHLLDHQGYKKRMLGPKIGELQEHIASGKAPRWALQLDVKFLEVLNTLAKYAIHPGEETIENQKKYDSALISRVEVAFQELLWTVYERPLEESARLQKLDDAAADMK